MNAGLAYALGGPRRGPQRPRTQATVRVTSMLPRVAFE